MSRYKPKQMVKALGLHSNNLDSSARSCDSDSDIADFMAQVEEARTESSSESRGCPDTAAGRPKGKHSPKQNKKTTNDEASSGDLESLRFLNADLSSRWTDLSERSDKPVVPRVKQRRSKDDISGENEELRTSDHSHDTANMDTLRLSYQTTETGAFTLNSEALFAKEHPSLDFGNSYTKPVTMKTPMRKSKSISGKSLRSSDTTPMKKSSSDPKTNRRASTGDDVSAKAPKRKSKTHLQMDFYDFAKFNWGNDEEKDKKNAEWSSSKRRSSKKGDILQDFCDPNSTFDGGSQCSSSTEDSKSQTSAPNFKALLRSTSIGNSLALLKHMNSNLTKRNSNSYDLRTSITDTNGIDDSFAERESQAGHWARSDSSSEVDDYPWSGSFSGMGDFNAHEVYTMYRPGRVVMRRCIFVMLVIAIVAVCSALIGFYIPDEDSSLRAEGVGTVGIASGGTSSKKPVLFGGSGSTEYTVEDLFRITEKVVHHCNEENLKTTSGRIGCQQVCNDHLCCFGTSGDGYNCLDDRNELCMVYAGCGMLVSDLLSQEVVNENVASSGIEETSSLVMDKDVAHYCSRRYIQSSSRTECEDVCEHHLCCFDDDGSKNCYEDESKHCMAYAGCIVLADPNSVLDLETDSINIVETPAGNEAEASDEEALSDEDAKQIAANVDQYCTKEIIESTSGGKDCEAICKSHFCCFEDDEDYNCQDEEEELCNLYTGCSLLFQELLMEGMSVDDFDLDIDYDDDTKVIDASYVESVMSEWDEIDEYKQHDSLSEALLDIEDDEGDASTIEESSQIDENSEPSEAADEDAVDIASLESESQPSESPATEEDSSKPVLSSENPKPSGAVGESKPAAADRDQPPAPPIRCIPNGDDEINTEVFTDDWNDDRYDRCRRWEKKYGMKVTEYWDQYEGKDEHLGDEDETPQSDSTNENAKDAGDKKEGSEADTPLLDSTNEEISNAGEEELGYDYDTMDYAGEEDDFDDNYDILIAVDGESKTKTSEDDYAAGVIDFSGTRS